MFELGEFYLQYDELMAHWNKLLPGKILRVQYEDVVQDLQTQVRRILEHCELPFEENCIDFSNQICDLTSDYQYMDT